MNSHLDRRRRRGLTLIETLFGVSFLLVLFSGAWLIFGTGIRGFYRDAGHSSSMQDAMVFLERFDSDLDELMVPAALAARPVWISRKKDRVRFYIPAEGEMQKPLGESIRGTPIDYVLTPVPGSEEEFFPTRNGVPIRRLRLHGWSFRLTSQGAGPRGMVWLEMEVEAAGLFGRKRFTLRRRVALPAAASARRWGSAYSYLDRWSNLDSGEEEGLWPEDDPPDPPEETP